MLLVGAQGSYHEVGIFFAKIENLWWWTNYASHQQGSLTLLLLADITYVFCGGVACRKMLPTIINLVHAAFWEEAEALLRRSWPSSCWATFVFDTMGPTKKGNFGPVCLSYPATKSVQLTTRVNTTTNFPTSVMGYFSLIWCSNVRTHQVPCNKVLIFRNLYLGRVCGHKKKLGLLKIMYYINIFRRSTLASSK